MYKILNEYMAIYNSIIGYLLRWNKILWIYFMHNHVHSVSFVIDNYRKKIGFMPSVSCVAFGSYLPKWIDLLTANVITNGVTRVTCRTTSSWIAHNNSTFVFFFFSLRFLCLFLKRMQTALTQIALCMTKDRDQLGLNDVRNLCVL